MIMEDTYIKYSNVIRNTFILSLFFMLAFPIVGGAESFVSNEADLKTALTSSEDDEIKITENFTLNSAINVAGNKSIDLQGNQLTLKEGTNDTATGKFILNRTDNKRFELKNGSIMGGDTRGLASVAGNIGVISVGATPTDLITTVQDITHTGKGGFYKGRNSDVVFKGKIALNNGHFNVRAKNMTFYGNPNDPLDPENTDFYGYTDAQGGPNASSTGNGGLNLSFDGYVEGAKGPNTRILNIDKNANVKLKNDNRADVIYGNNVGNFAVMNISGTFEAEAVATSLRTTASQPSLTSAGTASGQAEINVLPDSTFKILSTSASASNGAIFTYSLDINVEQPKFFDIRYFGNGLFFYSFADRKGSNFNVKNSNIGVWKKSDKGIGNPTDIWTDVESLNIIEFGSGRPKKQTSSDADLAQRFDINNYSRISNDVTLPRIVPDQEFKADATNYFVNNGSSQFFGTTEYYDPTGILEEKVSSGSEIGLYFGNQLKEKTIVDEEGNWVFDNFDAKKYPAGKYELRLVDSDFRTANLSIDVKDTLAPIVETKLYSFQMNTMTALQQPQKDSIKSIVDETSPTDKHVVVYDISEEERVDIISKPGYYEIDVKVTDEAGNTTVVSAPVIVYEGSVKPTTSFVSGNDFEVPYEEWNDSDEFGKREIVIDPKYGNAKGYTILGDQVTEVTKDDTQFIISYTTPADGWKPDTSYPVTIKVGNYSKIISMKLGNARVSVTINQVYKGTKDAIYGDLLNEVKLEPIKEYGFVGESINTLIDTLIKNDTLVIDHVGYDKIEKTDFEVFVGGEDWKGDTIPDKDFEIIYSYTGQLRLEKIPVLDFGKLQMSKEPMIHSLSKNAQSELVIINTLKNENWKLNVSLPKGIKRIENSENFIGELMYIDKNGNKITIDDSSNKILEQEEFMKVQSTFDFKQQGESGMNLIQELGNSQGVYKGEVVWSIEDVL